MVTTATSLFNKINNINITTPNGLNGALAKVDYKKGL